jgi:hypothetical protein
MPCRLLKAFLGDLSSKSMKKRIYTVHLLDSVDLVLVRQGFNWPAFFFAVPWALFHRMWGAAASFVVLQTVLAAIFVSDGLSGMQQAVLGFILSTIIATSADVLRAHALAGRGYILTEVVVEENSDRALRRFLEARQEVMAIPAEPSS